MSVGCAGASTLGEDDDVNEEHQDPMLSTDDDFNTTDTERSQKVMDVAVQSWKAGLYTDVTIVVGDQRFPAHRLILASMSNYFPPLLKLDEKESGEVTIHNIHPDDFFILLNYAYTGKVDITKDNVQCVLIASDYLNVAHVKDMCIKFMTVHFTVDDVSDVLAFALEYPLPELIESAQQFLKENLNDVSNAESFFQLDPKYLERFFDDDKLVLYSNRVTLTSENREILILNAVLRYLSKTANNNPDVVEQLIRTVRLAHIQKDAVMQSLDNFKNLKNNEVIKKYVKLREIAAKCIQERKKRPGAYKDTQGIPESWFHNRKYAVFSIYHRDDHRYAAGGQIEPSPNEPNFLYNDSSLEIKRIEIWLRTWDGRVVIGGLALSYRSAFDNDSSLVYRRGSCPPSQAEHIVELEPDEFITKVVIGCGFLIDRLGFETNRGRVLGPFGGPGGSEYTELAPRGSLSYLFDINCDSVNTQGSDAIYNLMLRWVTFK